MTSLEELNWPLYTWALTYSSKSAEKATVIIMGLPLVIAVYIVGEARDKVNSSIITA